MNILLIYYTGTYNTRYLTKKVKERFVSGGHTVDTVEITSSLPPCPTEGYDLVGFSYPIYGFNSPRPFNAYVAALRFPKGQRYFIYKNSGETFAMNNASSRVLIRRMRRRGAVLVGEYHFVMPYNIHFPFERDFVREILAMNAMQLDIMMHDLATGTVRRIVSSSLYNFAAFFVGIQKIGGDVNSFFYRVDADKCVSCGLCVRSCPHGNIYTKKGRIKFHHHCDMCMRCSFFCPTDAIHIGFLDGWRVNGAYDLEGAERDGAPSVPYITKHSRGFYRCFISHFEGIKQEHERLFGGPSESSKETEEKTE